MAGAQAGGLTIGVFGLELPAYAAGIAQLVEHNLAKVGVASSSLVSRSIFPSLGSSGLFCLPGIAGTLIQARWQSGHAAACKAVNAGSIPTLASKKCWIEVQEPALCGFFHGLDFFSERGP